MVPRRTGGEVRADAPSKETASHRQLIYFAATCPECEITIDDDTIAAAVRRAKHVKQFLYTNGRVLGKKLSVDIRPGETTKTTLSYTSDRFER